MSPAEYSTADILTILLRAKNFPSEEVESETIEFKMPTQKKDIHGDRVVASLCAFANHLGGILIIGVRDSSENQNDNWGEQLIGLEKVDGIEIEKRIRGKIQNKINLRVENINFEDKNYVAICVVKSLEDLVTTTSGKIYIREGRDSRPMRPEEIKDAVKSLQNYDWSADTLYRVPLSSLNEMDVREALEHYASMRNQEIEPTKEKFLESIEVTKNGILTKGGLLFLGDTKAIQKYLGEYEYRLSWKEGTELKINEIWSGNIWSSIKKARALFKNCVLKVKLILWGMSLKFPILTPLPLMRPLSIPLYTETIHCME